MIFHAFLIKYAEIAIKGKNRYLFEDALVKQMRLALEPVEGDFRVIKEQGRVYVLCPEEYDFDEAVEALQRVFGIVGISPVVIYEDQGFEQMGKDVVSYMKARYPEFSGTFKVYTRRARKSYPIKFHGGQRKSWRADSGRFSGGLLWMSTILSLHFLWRSERRFTFIQKLFRDRAECRLEQTERQCCFFPAELTVRLPAT